MNDAMHKHQELTTADIARGDRALEAESKDTRAMGGPKMGAQQQSAPLFPAGEAQEFRSRWDSIQTGFVDEPRKSVEQADTLVATTMQRLAEMFAEERSKLEGQWDRGNDVSTEDLRLGLQRYRSFFTRLLSV